MNGEREGIFARHLSRRSDVADTERRRCDLACDSESPVELGYELANLCRVAAIHWQSKSAIVFEFQIAVVPYEAIHPGD